MYVPIVSLGSAQQMGRSIHRLTAANLISTCKVPAKYLRNAVPLTGPHGEREGERGSLSPRSTRCRHVAAHPAFPLGLSTLEGPMRLPTKRGICLTGPASACLSVSVGFLCDRFALTDVHYVLAMTAKPWAPPPPSSRPYTGIGASPAMEHTVLEFPSSIRKDVQASRSCLLDAERIRDSLYGKQASAWPPPAHCGPGGSAIGLLWAACGV
jgi:hypothetical protein